MKGEIELDFSIRDSGRCKIFTLKGKIDWEDAHTLDKEASSLINEGFVHIAFIFDEVISMCSALIGALVFNLNKAKKLNGAFYLISSNKNVNSVFETLKFDIVFDGYLFTSFDDFRKEILDKEK